MPDSAKIRCMHDAAGLAGGTAEVVWLGAMNHATTLEAAENWLADRSIRNDVTVFIAVENGTYSAESFSVAGRRIEFCGHGALAAAFCVLEQHPDTHAALSFRNGWRSWEARHNVTSNFNIKLSFAQPDVQEVAVPDFVKDCLDQQPLAAAAAGGDSDYLILELGSEADVGRLQPDFAAISAATQRALIVTASAGADIVYRYFAPQYGEPEDAATGSAAVQLASYWQPRRQAESFMARQLSASGALVELACSGGKVEMAARVGYG